MPQFKVHFTLDGVAGSVVVDAPTTAKAAEKVRKEFTDARVKKTKVWKKIDIEPEKTVATGGEDNYTGNLVAYGVAIKRLRETGEMQYILKGEING